MKKLTVYKILSYILLPIGVLLGIATLFSLLMALGNFALLFSVFIAAATVIYIFSSFVFLQKAVIKQLNCKYGLKDLVKVNAYVALVFAVLGVVESVSILSSKEMRDLVVDAMLTNYPPQLKIDKAQVLQSIKAGMYIVLFIGIVLQVHISLTFRYIRENNHLFVRK
jgi:hypothetical protein